MVRVGRRRSRRWAPVPRAGQGYTLVAKHPKWVAVCDKLTTGEVVREMTVDHPVTVK